MDRRHGNLSCIHVEALFDYMVVVSIDFENSELCPIIIVFGVTPWEKPNKALLGLRNVRHNINMRDVHSQYQSAMEPPPGIIPNFDDPYSLERYILPTQIVFLVLIAVFVMMRMYTCTFVIRRVGVEECTSYACSLFDSVLKHSRYLFGVLGELHSTDPLDLWLQLTAFTLATFCCLLGPHP